MRILVWRAVVWNAPPPSPEVFAKFTRTMRKSVVDAYLTIQANYAHDDVGIWETTPSLAGRNVAAATKL